MGERLTTHFFGDGCTPPHVEIAPTFYHDQLDPTCPVTGTVRYVTTGPWSIWTDSRRDGTANSCHECNNYPPEAMPDVAAWLGVEQGEREVRLWTVRVKGWGGPDWRVGPENGVTYRGSSARLFGWAPGVAKYTSRPKRLARLVASCQRWCDRQNAKELADRDRTARLLG